MIWNNNFQFCNCGDFRSCISCPHRINCMKSALKVTTSPPKKVPPCDSSVNDLLNQIDVLKKENFQIKQLADSRERQNKLLIEKRDYLLAENQKLEKEIQELKKNKNLSAEQNVNKENALQPLENHGLAVEEGSVLVPKKGLFGTKYVEQKVKKK